MSDSSVSADDRTEPSRAGDAGRDGDDSRRTPPGPSGWPLLGNTVAFVRDPFTYYADLERYGDVVRHEVMGNTWTVLFHPDHVEEVLVRNPHRFERYNFEEFGPDFAPDGLLFSKGEQWRRQRQLIQPAFTPARVAAFADSMVARAADTADSWDDGETILVDHELSELTLEILTKTLFDVDLEAHHEAITGAARALNDTTETGRLTAFLPTWVPTPENRRYRRTMRRFDEVVTDLLAERRTPERNQDSTDDTDNDLLSTLLDATDEDGRSLSDTELRDQLMTFLFAGHETSSLALTYAFVLLSENPDVRERLEAELESVCGEDDPTMTDLPDLEYTEWVVDETMRLYPPAYALFREAREDVTIGGYHVPEGTKITLPTFAIQTDERWWDRPAEFRPARWGEDTDRPEYASFPFGGGPRHCVAMRFATMELTLVLATIAKRVRLDLEGDTPEVRMAATLSPVEPVEMTVRPRS